jgi:hypothetical protein
VQANEGVGVQPMSADTVPPVDHHHADVRMVDQRVRERHPRGAGADHQVVGLQELHHRHMLTLPGETGQRPVRVISTTSTNGA